MTLILASNAIYPLFFSPIGLFGSETNFFFFFSSSSTILGISLISVNAGDD